MSREAIRTGIELGTRLISGDSGPVGIRSHQSQPSRRPSSTAAPFLMKREKITTLPLKELHQSLQSGDISRSELMEAVFEGTSEAFASNAYLAWNADQICEAASTVSADGVGGPGLGGLPVSVKDIFDVQGVPTTCGSRFYSATRPTPDRDAGYVLRWRRAGAWLAGKTNLNEFAYGITGENCYFGDCTLPGKPMCLTGGSSSGAAASVAAGSACLALGTDTGGSLRVPAALCGLVSFRQSLGFGENDGLFPLAHSFDTVGWIQRHLGDVSWVARCLHPETEVAAPIHHPCITVLRGPWMEDVSSEILEALQLLSERLSQGGAEVIEREAQGFEEASALFVPIQAHDAFAAHGPFWSTHQGDYDPAVRGRIDAGSRVDAARYQELQEQRQAWVARSFEPLWAESNFLLAPATSMTQLAAGADHTATRPRLLRLTTPASLAGLPVLTTPNKPGESTGIGFQWMARPGRDAELWALAEWLAILE